MEAAMNKQVLCVGVDVGAETLWASVDGVRPKSFSHTASGIRGLHRWAARQANGAVVHLCMEATGVYSQHVAMRLLGLPETEVSIVNPACIKAYAKMQLRRSKTDAVDAEVIRRYAASQQPPAWQPAPNVMRHLHALVAQVDALRDTLNQWRNRAHAHEYIPDIPPAVKKSQRALERALAREIARIEAAIDQLCATDPGLAQQVMLLETVTGIARTSAVRLLAYGQEWLTQRSAKALVAHAGLAPHHYQSGTSINGKSRIDKRGNRNLRKALYMPALTGIVHNPLLRDFYHRLCDKGKPKKVALIACMKKLLLIVRSMLIHKTTFNPNLKPLT
jgi:transposase